MLTRCEHGMVVVTNRRFLDGPGHDTLLGRLAKHWTTDSNAWVDSLAISTRQVDLPGSPGRPTDSASTRGVPLPLHSPRASHSLAHASRPPTSQAYSSSNAFEAMSRARYFTSPAKIPSADFPPSQQRGRDSAAFPTLQSDLFPPLQGGNARRAQASSVPRPTVIQGRWKHGSDACRL